MYRPEAKKVRKCTAIRKDGHPCQGWAMWGDPFQRCMTYAGRHHRGPMSPMLAPKRNANYPPCLCKATTGLIALVVGYVDGPWDQNLS